MSAHLSHASIEGPGIQGLFFDAFRLDQLSFLCHGEISILMAASWQPRFMMSSILITRRDEKHIPLQDRRKIHEEVNEFNNKSKASFASLDIDTGLRNSL